ncbi:sensor domain-containing diguanylate cyclase [Thiomicrorhabdus sp. 6S3-12]|uniref:GGDEF domain-containing protein n=1 Tax=Thiomicrorhabdus sp. 6S3-12 TaxID=2819681 RepID=UPI001AAD6203|nr:sensor domain-containing diguanylate cyclase [Thiomicrorhabdus sp. 6S3-12]MBO1924182.1 diguanylate cyclase [Thiomicrorhabdus sp. 6S3-12]
MPKILSWTKEHSLYQEQINRILLRFILLVAAPSLLLLAAISFVNQNYVFTVINLISLGIVGFAFSLSSNSETKNISKDVTLAAIYIPYLTTLFYLDAHHLGFLWIMLIPIVLVFLNSPKELLFWSTALFAPLILVALINYLQLAQTNLHYTQAINSAIGLLIEGVFLFYIKHTIFSDQLKLKYKNRQLEFNKQLIDEKVPILSLDVNGKIIKANSAFMEITGYRQMALIGKTLDQLDILNEELDHFSLSNILKNKSWSGELHGRRRSGAQFWMNVTIREEFNSKFEKIGFMALCEDITSQQLLKLHANHDQLTGALNRRVFDQFIQKSVHEFQRYREPFSLIICDIDYFKKINDSFGHNFGDEILKQLYSELSKILRGSDSICRWGGEEFAILLPKTGLDLGVRVAEKVRQHINTTEFAGQYPLTISLGVAEIRIDEKAEDWFARADRALYDAKENGRNKVSFSSH